MNLRKNLFFTLSSLKGRKLGKYYRSYCQQVDHGIAPGITQHLLVSLLDHCKQSVPYYSKIIDQINTSYKDDPFEYLQVFPILTKDIIRANFEALQSSDLSRRKWYVSASGGSTGEPIEIIQDRDYSDRVGALSLLYSKLAGREIGELQVQLWGSVRDITNRSESIKSRFQARLSKHVLFNAFRMTPEQITNFVSFLNKRKPRLILSYATSLYDVAKYINDKEMRVVPQNSIITSAETLFPYMREMIEHVFHCRVYNRYGSREVGDIACERPGMDGLWVAPWGNFVEIVDEAGNRVPDGDEGEILITSLSNYAMPLIRYRIGDRGFLLPDKGGKALQTGQVFGEITGRTDNSFRTKNGTIISAGYFAFILYNRQWIKQYQVIQRDYTDVLYKVVRSGLELNPSELEDIRSKTKYILGNDCNIDFEFTDDIAESPSGKFHYFISKVQS